MPNHISRDDLHHQMTNGRGPALVEALGVGYYADGHLPGAINIPPGQVDALAPRLLADRQQPIVVYGSATSASAAAVAKRLEELGYATVALYSRGKEDWVEHGLPLERLDTDSR